jgi:Flp pilus assembly protein TadG
MAVLGRLVRLRRRRRGLVANETGAVAIEFAFICPILLAFVGGIVEGSLLLYTWGNMEHLSRQAARAVAIGAATDAQAISFVNTKMQSSLGKLAVTTAVVTSAGATPLENQVTVRVTVTGAQLARMLPFGIFRLTNLESTVSLRLET